MMHGLEKAIHYITLVDYYSTISSLNKVPVSYKNDFETLFLEGQSLYKVGNSEKALTTFNKILDIIPNSTVAKTHKGIILTDLENTTEACKLFDQVLLVEPSNNL